MKTKMKQNDKLMRRWSTVQSGQVVRCGCGLWTKAKHAMLLSILPPTSYSFELMLKMGNWGFNDCKIMLLPSM
jgi:hypothetical protein